VLYFAGVADITQHDSESVGLDDDRTTVDGMVAYLATQYGPPFQRILETCLFAVDMEYVDRTHLLKPGQEMAIIPPVSGG
jgi:molybdopterin converting factor subunit 1